MELQNPKIRKVCHVIWVHHHSMACPWVVDRGDSTQTWRVAANTLNKQSQTADNGRSSSLGGWVRG